MTCRMMPCLADQLEAALTVAMCLNTPGATFREYFSQNIIWKTWLWHGCRGQGIVGQTLNEQLALTIILLTTVPYLLSPRLVKASCLVNFPR